MTKIFSDLSIIIPTFYPGEIINNCIDSLPQESDIIIVDNGDDPELEYILKNKYPRIRHYKIGDIGLPKSFNFAVKKSKNENILITQPDVTFEKDTISNLISASIKYPDAGIIAPIIFEDKKYSLYDTLNLNLSKTGELQVKKISKSINIMPSGDFCAQAVNATAMLIKKNIIKKVNGWDENIYTYLEDIDLCIKIRKNNFQIIKIPKATVNHIGFGSHKKENAQKAELSRNWHFCWSSLYFRDKYTKKSEFILFFISVFTKYFSKVFVNLILFNKKKVKINFIRLRACLNYITQKKSSYRY